MAFYLQISFMNYIRKINSKHGIFNFCNSDLMIGRSLIEYGEFSEIEFSAMNKFIKDGDIILEIGANIGCFCIPIAKKVGSNGKVYAFEPQKFIFNLLKKNIECNELKNVQVFNNAIGNTNKILELNDFDYSQQGNFGGIGLKEDYDNSCCARIKGTKKNKIQTFTLNNFLNLKKCNFIKIDVELMELDVLSGGNEFIKKFRPIIWLENQNDFPNKINDYLLSIEYQPFWMETWLYNQNNYFLNQSNFFGKTCTLNTLAIPKEVSNNYMTIFFDKVSTPNCRPKKSYLRTFS